MVEMEVVRLEVEAIEEVELKLKGCQEAVVFRWPDLAEKQGKPAQGLKKQEGPMWEKNPEKVMLTPSI